jgi:hypothetical protein
MRVVPSQPEHADTDQRVVEGEPTIISLKRFARDRTLRGRLWNTCCDCGLTHLWTFEVFPDPEDRQYWWLNKRAYRPTEALVPKRKTKKRK